MNFFKLSLTIIFLIVTLAPALNAEPGDVLAEYEVPYTSTIGLAWDPDHNWMWGLNYRDPSRLYAIDPVDGEVVAGFDVAQENAGLFYLNGVLYISGFNNNPNTIYRYDTDGNELDSWNSPINLANTWIATDGEFLFTSSDQEYVIHVFNLDDLNEIAIIDYDETVGNDRCYSIEWVTAHPDGQLWLSGVGHFYQCSIDDDWNCELVQDFETVAACQRCIAHDGENLWHGIWEGELIWYVIDDGVSEANWLAYDPAEGEVEGEGQQEVNVTIDAAGLIDGDYDADMTFSTNEPDAEDVIVNLLMHVAGAPVLTVTWSEEFGFNPDDPEASIIDWNLAYPEDLFTDVPYDITVNVANTGTADLEVDGIFCEDFHFIPDTDQIILSHDESADMIITFVTAVDESGLFESVMSFQSNDLANPLIEVALRAEALQPPVARIEPLSIEDELFTGQVEVYPITVFNDGQSPLRFTITHEIISEPLHGEGNLNPRVRAPRRIDARNDGNNVLFK